jgi:hypothetical protein
LFSLFEIFVLHLEEKAFVGQVRQIMIGLEAFVEVVKLGEPFLHVPFVVSALKFEGEVYSIFFSFVLLKSGYCDLNSGSQVIIVG